MTRFNRLPFNCTPSSSQRASLRHLTTVLLAGLTTLGTAIMAIATEPPLPPSNAGPRGELCVLTPNVPGAAAPIWAAHPTLIWTGIAAQIEVYPDQLEQSEPISGWTYTPPPEQRSVVYPTPLEPGQSYGWQISNRFNAPVFMATFQRVDAETASQIELELAELDTSLATASADDVALARAVYFGERGLWTDALATLLTITEPESASAEYFAAIQAHLCGQ